MFNRKHKKIVFCAVSGGVDSSVAAALLKRQGYDVVGVHMRCWYWDAASPHGAGEPRLYEERRGCAAQDAEDARRAAEVLGIPFYVFDFEREYKKKVVEYMIDGYRKGITPNPDVMCNKEIKFGLFLKKSLEMGADYIATGHYVRLLKIKSQIFSLREISRRETNLKSKLLITNYQLLIARDLNKDQSYFLWTLTQEQLKHCLFPIGEYKKPQVRAMARKFGLLNAGKNDSQGICFLGKVTLSDFLKQYIPERKGTVLTTTGEVLGEHRGAHYYTAGQRHGIGIGGGEPLYVADKNVRTNTLVVVEESDNPALYKKEIELTNVNFINPQLITNNQEQVYARVRYRQPLASATLICHKSSVVSYKLIFAEPQKFVAPGQSAVFYSTKGEMLGGGVII